MIMPLAEARLWSLATEDPGFLAHAAPLRFELLNQVVLRDYQAYILRRVAAAMAAGFRRVLVVLPTGGGKTVLAAEVLKCVTALGGRGQFLVHRKELIDQTSRSFLAAGLDHGFIAAGRPPSALPTTIAGVQTLVNRLHIHLPPNLAVVDEAHHAVASSWQQIFEAYPDSFLLGLTATPQRLDGKGLEAQFDIMIEGPSGADLIERGFLSPYDYYAPTLPDIETARTEQQAERVMDTPDIVGDMVEHYLRLAVGQPGIVFAHSVAHSKHLVDAYQAYGVRAGHIDGDMSAAERERIDAMFRARDIDVLSNCSLLGEGYDVPGVVYCGLGRRTQSLSWYRQMVGRALRPIYAADADLSSDEARCAAIATGPKPQAIICDHASNVFVHGFPDDDVEWSLGSRETKSQSSDASDADPVRQCMECYRAYPSVLPRCPGCGAEKATSPRQIREERGELQRLDREALKAKKAEEKAAAREKRIAEERACTCFADYYDLAVARAYPKAKTWARNRARMKSGNFNF